MSSHNATNEIHAGPREFRRRVILTASLAAVTLLAVAVALVIRADVFPSRPGMGRYLLMAASTGFVSVGLAGGGLRSAYGRFMLPALVLCWLGDYLGPHGFVGGLIAFLVAHLALMAAFWTRGVIPRRALAASAGTVPISGALFAWLYPHVPPEELLPVIAYLLTITAMVTVASAGRDGAGRILILLGAIIFYVSDIFVARWRFVDTSSINGTFCYPLYYTACVLLALSVLAREKEAADAAMQNLKCKTDNAK
jgi:uncharacterized membrane protein YhhN